MALTNPTEGAKCEHCKQYMLVADGCIEVKIAITKGPSTKKSKPVLMKPLKYGEEIRYNDVEGFVQPSIGDRCHDCGAKKGFFHHPGCDIEECPHCHHQMLMCGGECG
jgi:hypothetical protein